MVNNYKRKSNRQSWEERDMQSALDAVKQEGIGWLKAAKRFNVPQATLRRRAKGTNKLIHGTNKGLGRFQTTLPQEVETELLKHILDFESRLFGFTAIDVRKLAFELAEHQGFCHPFNKNKALAGWDWLKGFRSRHPELSLRCPEPTSAARAAAFNRPQVKRFF